MTVAIMMLGEEAAQSSSTGSIISLLMAFVLFIGIVAWVFIVPVGRWQRDARIPLDDDSCTKAATGGKEVNHE